MLPLQVSDQRLLLRKPPLSFSYVAFQLPQLIRKCIVEHHPTHHHHAQKQN
jgi:hypothetical protein